MRQITVNKLKNIYENMILFVLFCEDDYSYFIPHFKNSLGIISDERICGINELLASGENNEVISFNSLTFKVLTENNFKHYESRGSVTVNSDGSFIVDGLFKDGKDFEGIQILRDKFLSIVKQNSTEVEEDII